MMCSVIIPCYNRFKMLRRCVKTFIDQTFNDFEIIIVDDGSEENLKPILKLDPRIRYLRQEHNGYGAGLARNLGRDNAKGKYLLQFDSDDLAIPELLEKTVGFLESHTEYDMVYTDNFVRRTGQEDYILKHRDCGNTEEDYKAMLHNQFISHSGTLWVKNMMPDYDNEVGSAEDLDVFLTGMENGLKYYHLSEPLWTMRIGHSREANSERQNEGCRVALKKRGYGFNEKTRESYKL